MYALNLSLFFKKLLLNNFLLVLGDLHFFEENTFCLINCLWNIGIWHFCVFTLSRLYEDFLLLLLLWLHLLALFYFNWLGLLYRYSWCLSPINLLTFVNHHFGFSFFFCYYFRLKIFKIIIIFVCFLIWLFSFNILLFLFILFWFELLFYFNLFFK